jgi:hypothetical protein
VVPVLNLSAHIFGISRLYREVPKKDPNAVTFYQFLMSEATFKQWLFSFHKLITDRINLKFQFRFLMLSIFGADYMPTDYILRICVEKGIDWKHDLSFWKLVNPFKWTEAVVALVYSVLYEGWLVIELLLYAAYLFILNIESVITVATVAGFSYIAYWLHKNYKSLSEQ